MVDSKKSETYESGKIEPVLVAEPKPNTESKTEDRFQGWKITTRDSRKIEPSFEVEMEVKRGEVKEKSTLEELRVNVNNTREFYTSGYCNFLGKKKEESRLLRAKARLGIPRDFTEEETPEDLKLLKESYTQARREYAKVLYEEKSKKISDLYEVKKIELQGNKKNPTDQQKELDKLEQDLRAEMSKLRSSVYQEVVVMEHQKLQTMHVETFPPQEKGLIMKSWERWVKMGKLERLAYSTVMVAGVVGFGTLTVPVSSTVAAFTMAGVAGARIPRVLLSMGVAIGAGKLFDKLTEGGTAKTISAERFQQTILKKNFDINKMAEADESFAKISRESQNSKMWRTIKKAVVIGLVGGVVSAGMGMFANAYAGESVDMKAKIPENLPVQNGGIFPKETPSVESDILDPDKTMAQIEVMNRFVEKNGTENMDRLNKIVGTKMVEGVMTPSITPDMAEVAGIKISDGINSNEARVLKYWSEHLQIKPEEVKDSFLATQSSFIDTRGEQPQYPKGIEFKMVGGETLVPGEQPAPGTYYTIGGESILSPEEMVAQRQQIERPQFVGNHYHEVGMDAKISPVLNADSGYYKEVFGKDNIKSFMDIVGVRDEGSIRVLNISPEVARFVGIDIADGISDSEKEALTYWAGHTDELSTAGEAKNFFVEQWSNTELKKGVDVLYGKRGFLGIGSIVGSESPQWQLLKGVKISDLDRGSKVFQSDVVSPADIEKARNFVKNMEDTYKVGFSRELNLENYLREIIKTRYKGLE